MQGKKANSIYNDAREDMNGKMDFGDVLRSKNQVMKKGSSLGVLHKSAP